MRHKVTYLARCTKVSCITRNNTSGHIPLSSSQSRTKSIHKDYGHWTIKQNHRIFFDSLASKLNITQPSQWYNVSVKQVKENGGGSLLNYYNNSVAAALKAVYPNYPWQLFLFSKVPKKFWESDENVVEYLKWVMDHFGIKNLEDWEHVSKDQLLSSNCGALLNKKGGLKNLLQYYFPELKIRTIENHTRSKVQILLERHVSTIFQSPQYSTVILTASDITADYRHPDITFPGTNRNIEFDIYIPKLKVAIDYQGERHYVWTRMYGDPADQRKLDQSKRALCDQHGIVWIEIPFWWNRRKETIVATLQHYLPQFITSSPSTKPLLSESIPEKYLLRERNTQDHIVKQTNQVMSEDSEIESIQYRVSVGQPRGALSKCKACKKEFERGQLRLQIQGAFTPMGKQDPIPAKFSSCLSSRCIQKIENDSKKPGSGMFIPPFKDIIGIPTSISTDALKNEPLLQDNPNLKLIPFQ